MVVAIWSNIRQAFAVTAGAVEEVSSSSGAALSDVHLTRDHKSEEQSNDTIDRIGRIAVRVSIS